MSPLRQDFFSHSSDVNRDPNQLRLLADLLAQPEDDALDALRDMLPEAPWLAATIAELEDMPLEHWQAEHTRLFVSGFPKTPCPPFESAYRQGQMGGTVAGDLAAIYRRAGLHATGAPADYLGTLLECAAYLASLSPSAEGPGDGGEADAQRLLHEIWEDHLMRWVPSFADDLARHSRIDLYRLLGAQLAQLFPVVDRGEEGSRGVGAAPSPRWGLADSLAPWANRAGEGSRSSDRLRLEDTPPADHD